MTLARDMGYPDRRPWGRRAGAPTRRGTEQLDAATRPARGRRLTARLLLAASLVVAWSAVPAPAIASETSLEAAILTWLNEDRVAFGLRPYRLDGTLPAIAGTRAGRLADAGVLSHQAAGGSIGTELTDRGYPWYGTGENIAYTTAAWGSTAARSLYLAWKGSPTHWALLTSDRYNYVGVGVALSGSSGATYGSIVMAEAPDHTRPGARMASRSRVGTTISFTWVGWDAALQAHTAGLRDFDVQYRVDGGSWATIRNDTTATSVRLTSRRHGHTYSVRVRARDRGGNLSSWSAPLSVWVP